MDRTKKSIQYFSHDIDMRNDMKIRALRKRYGNEGYACWCFMLETLTDSETLDIEMSDLQLELLAGDFDIEQDTLKEMLEFMVHINLLQMDDEGHVYSARHQERIQETLQRYGYIRQIRSKAGKASAEVRRNKKEQETNKTEQTPNKHEQTSNKAEQNTTNRNRIELNRIEKEKDSLVKTPKIEDRIVALWNEIIQSPKVSKLTDSRRKKLKTRIQSWGCKTDDELLEKTTALFRKITESDFLSGRKGEWKATFDWIIANDENSQKVLDGNYDNKTASGSIKATRLPDVDTEVMLGYGEYITPEGRRTYGTGKANIPLDAPARPSERHYWDADSQQWKMQ